KLKLIATMAAMLFLSAAVIGVADDQKKQDKEKDKSKEQAAAAKKAPDFTLKDINGKTVALKDYKDKIVVLEWTNKDCPIWRGRMEVLKDTAKKYVAKGVVWLHIDSTGSQDDAKNVEFMKANSITQPVLADKDGKVGHAYEAKSTPHMFIIDKAGNISYQG